MNRPNHTPHIFKTAMAKEAVMKISTSYSPRKRQLPDQVLKEKQLDILLSNLFNFKNYDNNYFYYTEVFSEWVDRN